jgi:hypothetical protein
VKRGNPSSIGCPIALRSVGPGQSNGSVQNHCARRVDPPRPSGLRIKLLWKGTRREWLPYIYRFLRGPFFALIDRTDGVGLKSFYPLGKGPEDEDCSAGAASGRAYLEVEQLRLADRLTLEIDLNDASRRVPIPVPSVQPYSPPRWTLKSGHTWTPFRCPPRQPLVENAIKRGVARSSEPGYVRIRSHRGPGRLSIAVENSGSGLPAETAGTEIGLQNVRRRLEICFGSASTLKLTLTRERAIAEVEIPCAEIGLGEALRLQSQQVEGHAGPSLY